MGGPRVALQGPSPLTERHGFTPDAARAAWNPYPGERVGSDRSPDGQIESMSHTSSDRSSADPTFTNGRTPRLSVRVG